MPIDNNVDKVTPTPSAVMLPISSGLTVEQESFDEDRINDDTAPAR